MEVTVLLPAYNEELAVGQVIDAVQRVMAAQKLSYEILVVDDASTDGTASIARSRPSVRVISHRKHRGSGAARRTGVEHAAGKIIVLLDADATYTPEDIPRMLELFPDYDQVNGARSRESGTLKWLRIPAKWFIRALASYLAGTRIPDLNTGFKAFKREIMLKYLAMLPDGFSCVSTMTLAFLCNGYNVTWIKTEYRKRIGKSKFHPVKDTYFYVLTVFRMIMYFKPLNVLLPLGALVLGAGAVMLAAGISGKGAALQLCGVTGIVVALLIWCLGLISDLIIAQNRAR